MDPSNALCRECVDVHRRNVGSSVPGGVVFCGLRDLVAEARADVEKDEQSRSDDPDNELPVERRTTTRLKPVDQLAEEFAALVSRIRKEERMERFESALEPLLGDPSFAELRDQMARFAGTTRTVRALFLGWSTGHKIALHIVASLVAPARSRSLVIFDEPEAHLHHH